MADEVMTCANCGHTQATGAFCEACGAPLAAAAAPASEPTTSGPAGGSVPPPPRPAPGAQPQYAPAAPPPSPPSGYADLRDKGFWARFFDLSFREYVTPSVIKVLFVVFMVVIGLSVIGIIVNGFLISAGAGVMMLIGGLIWGFLSLLLARVFLEVVIVFFHIHASTEEIAKSKR